MKKTILLVAVLLGAVSASQAGVRFGFGFGLPLPLPLPSISIRTPVVSIAAPVYTAPVYTAPAPVCAAPPVVYSAPVCAPPLAYAPAPSVYLGLGPRWYGPGYRGWHGGWGYRGHWEGRGWGHRGWHR